MARRPLFGQPASRFLRIRITEEQWQELQIVRKDTQQPSVVAVVREAVNEYVADYRDNDPVFCRPKSLH